MEHKEFFHLESIVTYLAPRLSQQFTPFLNLTSPLIYTIYQQKHLNMAETKGPNGSTTNGKKALAPNVHLSGHPVLAHKISILRSSSTLPTGFRAVLREITFHLGHEATTSLTTRSIDISVPGVSASDHMDARGNKIVEKVALVPILRSGLGMVESMLELIPTAAVHHIGIYKQGSMPVMYYNRLPKKCAVDVAYVLDPTIGSAHTMLSVVGLLKKVIFAKNASCC